MYLNTANQISGKVYSLYTNAGNYLYLRRFSDSLVEENAKLRAQLYESKYDNRIDSGILTDSSAKTVQQYNYITARVIKNSVNKATNLIYLDRGKLQGVNREMGVISPTGIVGKIVSVTDNYSVAVSVLSRDYVSAKFRKNEFFGNVKWNGTNTSTASFENIPKHVPVSVGDTVVTSGFSQMYPRNIMIGTVKEVGAQPDKNFLDITIHLSTSFGSLNYVYIVNNLRKSEIQALDSLAAKHD